MRMLTVLSSVLKQRVYFPVAIFLDIRTELRISYVAAFPSYPVEAEKCASDVSRRTRGNVFFFPLLTFFIKSPRPQGAPLREGSVARGPFRQRSGLLNTICFTGNCTIQCSRTFADIGLFQKTSGPGDLSNRTRTGQCQVAYCVSRANLFYGRQLSSWRVVLVGQLDAI